MAGGDPVAEHGPVDEGAHSGHVLGPEAAAPQLDQVVAAPDVVDQNVEPAVRGLDPRGQRLDLGVHRVVDPHRDSRAPAAAPINSAVSSMVSGRPGVAGAPRVLRPVHQTLAPAAASSWAMPRPAARVAPATSATCPCSGCSGVGIGPSGA